MMKIEDWRKIEELLNRALELEPARRVEFLDEIDSPELRREVESLLAAESNAGDFLAAPAIALSDDFFDATDALAARRIGHYKIIKEIGRGGMGAVYLAERDDGEFNQKVAVKIIRQTIADASLVRYFKREREILASLNHPYIARLIDGGVNADGAPFLAMEYVEGVPVNEFVESENPTLEEKLRLFVKICAGVAYAHRNLIVHRDIKPSNIFVTADGTPKLLDFGLAKILETSADSLQTETALQPMTLAYASPEQLKGEQITTASDIYSLGVVLYELLTAHRPFYFESNKIQDIIKNVGESEPPRPSSIVSGHHSNERAATVYTEAQATNGDSQINRKSNVQNLKSLAGDIDNIVLKALRREPNRRYQSVEAFSDDIERHLSGLPVKARPNTFSYRAEKFIARHKFGVAASALILLTFVGGAAATVWQWQRAEAQRARAERRFGDVRKLSNSLMFEIHDSVQNLAGATPTRRLIVSRALEYLDSLAQEAASDADLQRELATAYEKVGDIQGNPYSANLGDTDGALASYKKALAIRETLRETEKTIETEMETGRAFRGLGDILEAKGDFAESLADYRRSLAVFEELSAANPSDAAILDELARAFETLGDGLTHAEKSGENLPFYVKNLEIRQDLLHRNPADVKQQRSTALAFLKTGSAQAQTNKTEAIENLRRSIQMLEALSVSDPKNVAARRALGHAYFVTGNALNQIGDYVAALESRRKAFEIRREIAGQDASNQQAQFDFAVAYADLAEALTYTNEFAEAFENGRNSLELLEKLSASDPTDAVYRRNIGYCYERMARAKERLAAVGKSSNKVRGKLLDEAADLYRKGLSVFTELETKGTLIPADAAKTQTLAAKINECLAARQNL